MQCQLLIGQVSLTEVALASHMHFMWPVSFRFATWLYQIEVIGPSWHQRLNH